MELLNKKVLIGVTGGIAAYKTCDLIGKLKKAGAKIQVVMTESAQQFVSPVTFSALTGTKTHTGMFSGSGEIPHIELAQGTDLFAVIPATANIIGKYANGIADDLLSTALLAANCPVLFAPAMNVQMYNNCFVQCNLEKLKENGVVVLEPEVGKLACGSMGKGRLPSTDSLYREIVKVFKAECDLQGLNVMVTAGGTKEAIDPVRYIGNRSSGKMGHALAQKAKDRGAKVLLISSSDIQAPKVDRLIRVESAEEMHDVAMANYEQQNLVLMAAAVADYKPCKTHDSQIKKHSDSLIIELKKTVDILAAMGNIKTHQFLVGFAAETENLEASAMNKLMKKNLDLIVANDVSKPESVFGSDYNQVMILSKNGVEFQSKRCTKLEIANMILDIASRKCINKE